MSHFAYILLGSAVIYFGAYLLRWLVAGYAKLTGASLAAHNVRFATIGVASVLLILFTAIAESRLSTPDYSYLWTYVVGGALVFGLSLGQHYYWYQKRIQQSGDAGGGELTGFDPWGYKRPPSPAQEFRERDEDEADVFDRFIGTVTVVLIAAAVVATSTYDVAAEDFVWLMLTPVFWLGEGFVTAITNPYYLGGLVIGIGTGWIFRGAVSE